VFGGAGIYMEIDAVIRMKVQAVVTTFVFGAVRQLRDPRNHLNANFRSLWKRCVFGSVAKYQGEASGIVKLKSGAIIKVHDISGKYLPENCRITAK
jgi:hypothetical protein